MPFPPQYGLGSPNGPKVVRGTRAELQKQIEAGVDPFASFRSRGEVSEVEDPAAAAAARERARLAAAAAAGSASDESSGDDSSGE